MINDADKIILTVKGPYKITAIDSDIVLDRGRHLKRVYAVPTNSGFRIGGKNLRIYGIRVIPKKDAAIYIGKSRFRGIVDIIRTEKLKLMAVNHLDIEKYLYGVLYHEVPHYWPMETLKAQAIVARTFALYRIRNTSGKDYDVTSDIYSQVYGGRSSERRRTRRAVDLTRGKVLTYDGKIFPAYYHAICGGHTENAGVVFGMELPALEGRSCPYCKGARGFCWRAVFSYKEIENRLNKYGIKARGISYIKEGKRDASGRLETIRIKQKDGIKEIKGFKFRLALGPNIIRSTNFTLKNTPRKAVFRGKGWGHGVGMCQWGAFGMARAWKRYKDILEFYYPGAEITDMVRLRRFL